MNNIAVSVKGYVGFYLLNFIIQHKGVNLVKFCILQKDDEYINNITNLCNLRGIEYYFIDMNSKEFLELVKENNIDLYFMLWFPTILKKDTINSVPGGFINLHPSYLPYNKGMHPYYWSIIDETQAGVSIHFIDEKIDQGEIICQSKINTDITKTGETLYEEAESEIIKLFKENFNNIITMNYITKENTGGNFHLKKDIEGHSEIRLDEEYKAKDLINIIRARTFTGKPSSYFKLDGKKYYLNIKIYE